MDLRVATAEDRPALAEVFRAASLRWDSDRAWLLANPQHLVWPDAPLAEGRTRVATRDGRVVGFSTWEDAGSALELVDLFVDPAQMRSGVGTALMADLVALAAAMGRRAIEVTGNAHAMPFYTSVGFVVIGEAATEGGTAPRLRRVVEPQGAQP